MADTDRPYPESVEHIEPKYRIGQQLPLTPENPTYPLVIVGMRIIVHSTTPVQLTVAPAEWEYLLKRKTRRGYHPYAEVVSNHAWHLESEIAYEMGQ